MAQKSPEDLAAAIEKAMKRGDAAPPKELFDLVGRILRALESIADSAERIAQSVSTR